MLEKLLNKKIKENEICRKNIQCERLKIVDRFSKEIAEVILKGIIEEVATIINEVFKIISWEIFIEISGKIRNLITESIDSGIIKKKLQWICRRRCWEDIKKNPEWFKKVGDS